MFELGCRKRKLPIVYLGPPLGASYNLTIFWYSMEGVHKRLALWKDSISLKVRGLHLSIVPCQVLPFTKCFFLSCPRQYALGLKRLKGSACEAGVCWRKRHILLGNHM